MAAPQPQPLEWVRGSDGKYRATDRDGNRWHIVQAASRRWEVYCNSVSEFSWPVTLADAKWHAEEEADPAARARRTQRRKAREQVRRERAERSTA